MMKKTVLAMALLAATGSAHATGCAMDSAFGSVTDPCEKEPDLVEETKAIEDKSLMTYNEASTSKSWTTSNRHVRGSYPDAEAACSALIAVGSGGKSALCDRDEAECNSMYEYAEDGEKKQLPLQYKYDLLDKISFDGVAPCYTFSDPWFNSWVYVGFVFTQPHDWSKCEVIPEDSVVVIQVPWTEDPQALSLDYALPLLVGGLPKERQVNEYGMTGPDGEYDSTIEMRAAGAPGDPNVYAFLTKADIRAALRYPDDWDGNAVLAVHNHSGTQAKKCLRFE